MDARFHVDRINLDHVISQLSALPLPLSGPQLGPQLHTQVMVEIMFVVNVLTIAAPFAALAFLPREAPATSLSGATLTVLLLGGPAFVIVTYVLSHTFFGIPPRYGMSAVPALGIVIAATLERRWLEFTAAGIALGAYLYVLLRLI